MIVLKAQEKAKREINKEIKLKIKSKNYVDYSLSQKKNYYNKIYKFIKDKNCIPQRLEYSKDKNRKTIEKKGEI